MKTEYQFENTDNIVRIELYDKKDDQKHPSFTIQRYGVYRLTIYNPVVEKLKPAYFVNVSLIKIFKNSEELAIKSFDKPVTINISRGAELLNIYIYQ